MFPCHRRRPQHHTPHCPRKDLTIKRSQEFRNGLDWHLWLKDVQHWQIGIQPISKPEQICTKTKRNKPNAPHSKTGGQILISLFLVGSFCAADLQAADTVSIAAQIAKPTETLRQSFGHWSLIRPSAQSSVCITSNIYSSPLPRLVFGDETAPRRGADEAAITLSVGKWDAAQTYSSFLKLFIAQPLQNNAVAANQRYRFKAGESAVLWFPNGTGINFATYDQRYKIVNPDKFDFLVESLQSQTEAELSGTLIKDNTTTLGQEDTFRVTLNLDGFKTAYQKMLKDCQ